MKKGSLAQMSYAFRREVYPHSFLLTVFLNQGVEHVGAASLTSREVEMRGPRALGASSRHNPIFAGNGEKRLASRASEVVSHADSGSGVNFPVVHPL